MHDMMMMMIIGVVVYLLEHKYVQFVALTSSHIFWEVI